jgi:hypothetical protein
MNKHKLGLVSLSALLALTPFVTQAACVVNGQPISCGFFVPILAALAIPAIFFCIVSTVFWVWMIVDVIQRKVEHKPLWVLVIIFGHLLGAVIYFFANVEEIKGHGNTVASVILAVLSMIPVLGIILGIVAVILGIVAKKKEAKHDPKVRGLTSAGIVLAIIGLAYNAVFILSALMTLASGAQVLKTNFVNMHKGNTLYWNGSYNPDTNVMYYRGVWGRPGASSSLPSSIDDSKIPQAI